MINLVRLVPIFVANLVSSVTLSHLDVLHADHIGSLRHVSHHTITIIVVHVLGLVEGIYLTHEILKLAMLVLVIRNPKIVRAAYHILLLVLHLTHSLIKNSLFDLLHSRPLYLVMFVLLTH